MTGPPLCFNFILIFTLFLSAFSAICVIFLSGPLAELLGTTRGTYEYTQAAGYLKGYAIGIPAYSLTLLKNPDLLAMNQDRLGLGAPVVQRQGEVFVFAKDMEKLMGRSAFRGVSPVDPFAGLWDTRL